MLLHLATLTVAVLFCLAVEQTMGIVCTVTQTTMVYTTSCASLVRGVTRPGQIYMEAAVCMAFVP